MKYTIPKIELDIYEVPKNFKSFYWELFKKHHYLSEKLNLSARCYVGYWDDIPVAFESILAMPSGTMKGAWREHRLVVLCDHQGLGLGSGMSEGVGELVRSWGGRFFSKTANIKLGEYRETSPRWKPTSTNKTNRIDLLHWDNKWSPCKEEYNHRVCYSHEYVGECDEHSNKQEKEKRVLGRAWSNVMLSNVLKTKKKISNHFDSQEGVMDGQGQGLQERVSKSTGSR